MLTKIDFVQLLIQNGYCAIPLKQTKIACFKGWNKKQAPLEDFKAATGVGLRTGDNGLVAIDIDSKYSDDPDGMPKQFLNRLEQYQFELEKVVIQDTPSKGIHILFRMDGPIGNKKLAIGPQEKAVVETRGVGGYIAVYNQEAIAAVTKLPVLTSEEVSILFAVAASYDTGKKSYSIKEDYNRRNSCLDILLGHGWTEVYRQGDMIRVKRSGNSDNPTSGSVFESINGACIFSTNAGVPTKKLLFPFDLTCHLDFGGNEIALKEKLKRDKNGSASSSSFNYFAKPMGDVLHEGKNAPVIRQMLGSLIYESEDTILMGRTNVGKTALGVQIANAIADGRSLWGLQNECPPQKVLYADLELSDRQLYKRYGDRFSPSENLFYFQKPKFNSKEELDFWGENIVEHLGKVIEACEAKFVLIDNITALQKDSTKAEDAVDLVSAIKVLKNKYDITLVIVAHPTKQPKEIPLDITQIAGSSRLTNMIDAAFAINYSNEGSNHRYLKSLKIRSGEFEHHEANVIKLQLTADNGFPEFTHTGFGEEYELLPRTYAINDTNTMEEVFELRKQGHSFKKIEELTGISSSTAHNWCQKNEVTPLTSDEGDNDVSIHPKSGLDELDEVLPF